MGKGNNSIFEDKDLLKKAYKKLKTDAYYDKTKVILKKEIVEFESRQDDEGAFDAVLCDLQISWSTLAMKSGMRIFGERFLIR